MEYQEVIYDSRVSKKQKELVTYMTSSLKIFLKAS